MELADLTRDDWEAPLRALQLRSQEGHAFAVTKEWLRRSEIAGWADHLQQLHDRLMAEIRGALCGARLRLGAVQQVCRQIRQGQRQTCKLMRAIVQKLNQSIANESVTDVLTPVAAWVLVEARLRNRRESSGTMSPATASSFILLGTALLLTARGRLPRMAQALSIRGPLIAWLGLNTGNHHADR
jgi:hypothetical protein